MQTLQFQVQDDLYDTIKDSGIDINSKVKDFLYNLVDDGYPSISTQEAKKRVNDAVDSYENGTMQVVSHQDMWNDIEMDCQAKIESRV